MQGAKRSVLAAIADVQTMMSQVANHIEQSYVNGQYDLIQPIYILN